MGQSLIVEINEYQKDVPGSSCVEYHLKDMAEVSDATISEVASQQQPCPNVVLDGKPVGEHWIGGAKFQVAEDAKARRGDVVHIGLVVLRFPELETDLLVVAHVQQTELKPENAAKELAAEMALKLHASIGFHWPQFFHMFGRDAAGNLQN